jgi:7-cyano-7-deazaguanine synthase
MQVTLGLGLDTHTCYMGDHSTGHEWGYGCGTCPACELRANGWIRYLSLRA